MGINFPTAPAIGTVYPSPAQVGVPQYTWDGEKWTSGTIPFTGAVRYDVAQGLTEAQAVQGRSNVYAAPLDALAYSGMQINGSMDVSQERGGAGLALPGTGTFRAIDGWEVTKSGSPSTSNLTIFQFASTIPGYARSLNMTVTTAQASLSTHVIDLIQQIEGWRIARLGWGTAAAVPLTIGFWVKSSVTGALPVYILQSPFPTVNVTITTANVPQWMTLTIPAQTGGTWNGNDGLGLKLAFRIASAAAMNIASSTSNTFEITGVVVLPGIEAPTAARSALIMRPYDQELVTCQRYWEKVFMTVTSSSTYAAAAWYKAEKRAYPTITVISGNPLGATFDGGGLPLASLRQTAASSGITDVTLSVDARL